MSSKPTEQKWDTFFESVLDLCLNDPFKTRISLKYKNKKDLAIVKATDDVKTFIYKCTEEADLKKIDNLFKVATQILANIEEDTTQTGQATKEAAKKKSKKRG